MRGPISWTAQMKGATRRALLGRAGAALGLALLPKPLSAATTEPAVGNWGFDLAGMDPSVRPGDDFFRYGGGAWLKTAMIPADRSSWGPFFTLRAKAETDVKAIVDALMDHANAP